LSDDRGPAGTALNPTLRECHLAVFIRGVVGVGSSVVRCRVWVGEELGVVVVEADLPGCVVEGAVVVAAQEHEVVEAGGSAGGPVVDVVGVAHQGWAVAAGEGAVVVA
jgi:hypothetical protein